MKVFNEMRVELIEEKQGHGELKEKFRSNNLAMVLAKERDQVKERLAEEKKVNEKLRSKIAL